MSNSLVIGKDMGYDIVYNGPLFKSNILSLGGSSGLLRDDNAGGAGYMYYNYTGNIYLGTDRSNWFNAWATPSNYIQIGGSSHTMLALFGGFHMNAPQQTTLAGPSVRQGEFNRAFGTGSYFRVAAGKGTGTGRGSDLRLAIAPPGATSDSVLNPYVDVVTIAGASQYVGIGTTTPGAQLHTTGSVRFAGLTNDDTQTRVLVCDANGNLYFRTAASLAGVFSGGSSVAVAFGAGSSGADVSSGAGGGGVVSSVAGLTGSSGVAALSVVAGENASSIAALREEVSALKAEIEMLKQQKEEIISLQAQLKEVLVEIKKPRF
jgi:hypothetical protein